MNWAVKELHPRTQVDNIYREKGKDINNLMAMDMFSACD
jgi:hypothetical protein